MRVRRRRALKLLNRSVEESSGIQAGAVPAPLVCNTLYVPWYATPSVYLGMKHPLLALADSLHCIASPHYTLLLLNPMLLLPDVRSKPPWYATPWCTLVAWYAAPSCQIALADTRVIVLHCTGPLLSTGRAISFLCFSFARPNVTKAR